MCLSIAINPLYLNHIPQLLLLTSSYCHICLSHSLPFFSLHFNEFRNEGAKKIGKEPFCRALQRYCLRVCSRICDLMLTSMGALIEVLGLSHHYKALPAPYIAFPFSTATRMFYDADSANLPPHETMEKRVLTAFHRILVDNN